MRLVVVVTSAFEYGRMGWLLVRYGRPPGLMLRGGVR